MSVDSAFRMTVIEALAEAWDLREAGSEPNERRLNVRANLATPVRNEMAPDSPNPPTFHASQSKTARGDPLSMRRTIAPGRPGGRQPLVRRQAQRLTKRPLKERRYGHSFARKLLLGTAIAASIGIGYAIGAQPHMAETITFLQSARAELV